jgi:hypothetical protein
LVAIVSQARVLVGIVSQARILAITSVGSGRSMLVSERSMRVVMLGSEHSLLHHFRLDDGRLRF